ncbi:MULTISPECIES: zinc-binding dehydrogenase [unclassified Streptosporangium]|uniref:zinc-binding dehydrogenase n=1 Tax=unclassified Streptosporangium TaxID=2632669 RepID=UPI002E294A89|nr:MULTISPECIES: zinc-binding dehydrogenase [unclassified Streptosporangium]
MTPSLRVTRSEGRPSTHRKVRTTVNQVREDGAGLAELAAIVDAGQARPRIDSRYGLRDVRAAYERFLRGKLSGKVVLVF